MARFLYKAKNNKGEIVSGTVRAQSEVEAEKVLVKNNLVPIELSQQRNRPFFSFGRKMSLQDKALFSRQLSTMLSAGLSLTKAISIIARQVKNEHHREIFLSVYKDLQEGYSFSSALSKHPGAFDRVFVSVVNSGESTGKLDVVLNQLADQLENDNNFVSRVKSSLYYPAFIFVVMIIAGIVMVTFVVPKLKAMFEQADMALPWTTRTLLAISGFMESWWWLVLILIGSLIAFAKYWAVTDSGSRVIHSTQLKLPFFKNIFIGLYMYRFTRILSMLIGSGVPLLDALRISANVIDNSVYEDSILNAASQVEKGVPLSNPIMKDAAFPPIVGQMISVGEETGELDKILDKVATFYENSTNDLTKGIGSLIEPAVLIMVGLGVAFIVFSIYLPVYQINSTVK